MKADETILEYTKISKFPFGLQRGYLKKIDFEEKEYSLRRLKNISIDMTEAVNSCYDDSETAKELLIGGLALCRKFHRLYKKKEYSCPIERYDWLEAFLYEDHICIPWNPSWHPYIYLYKDKVRMNWVNTEADDELPEYEYGKMRRNMLMTDFVD